MRRDVRALTAAVLLSSAAGEARAQLPLEEMFALLAFPVLASFSDPTVETRLTVTNGSLSGVNLRLTYIAADGWNAVEGSCNLTALETSSIRVASTSSSTIDVLGECDGAQGDSTILSAMGGDGVLVVTLADPLDQTVNDNALYGSARIVDVSEGTTYTAEAVGFKGVDPLAPGLGDRAYAFDGAEFARFPDLWAMHFFAQHNPTLLSGGFIFATLDGRAGHAPRVELEIRYYDDDENTSVTEPYVFSCFDVVGFPTVDFGLSRALLGSAIGHLTIEPMANDQPDPKHDTVHGDGDGRRKTPVLVWYFQKVGSGGTIGGPTAIGELAFGARAHANRGALVPTGGDGDPVLDLRFIPEPAPSTLLLAGLGHLIALSRGRRRARLSRAASSRPARRGRGDP